MRKIIKNKNTGRPVFFNTRYLLTKALIDSTILYYGRVIKSNERNGFYEE